MAVGFRSERDGKKHCALIFAELRMLPEAMFKDYKHVRMCVILKKDNAIVEMGYG